MLELLDKPLLVVTGKGGVGKSTVAAALGLAAARRGLRTIIAEVSARDDVHRAMVAAGAPGDEGAVPSFAERAITEDLHHISIDPESALKEYLRDQLPRPAAEVLVSSRIFGLLAAATPGLRELLTVGKVWELAQPDRRTPGAQPYDLVVLDAPATGHGVAILSAPGVFADAALVGPVARQGRKIHEMLVDPASTGIIAVAAPEEMPVNETLGLRDALEDELGQRLAAVVVNGVLPQRFSGAEVEAIRAAPPSRAQRAALAEAARRRSQQAQLSRLRRGVDGLAVRTLPFLFEPEIGPAELERLSRELAR